MYILSPWPLQIALASYTFQHYDLQKHVLWLWGTTGLLLVFSAIMTLQKDTVWDSIVACVGAKPSILHGYRISVFKNNVNYISCSS